MADGIIAERCQSKHLVHDPVLKLIVDAFRLIPAQQHRLALVLSFSVVESRQGDGRWREHHRIGTERILVTQHGHVIILALDADFAFKEPRFRIVGVFNHRLQHLGMCLLVIALHKGILRRLKSLHGLLGMLGKSCRNQHQGKDYGQKSFHFSLSFSCLSIHLRKSATSTRAVIVLEVSALT